MDPEKYEIWIDRLILTLIALCALFYLCLSGAGSGGANP